MWNRRRNGERREDDRLIAVAIDKDKGSRYALRWAVDNILSRGQTVVLVHVNQTASTNPTPMANNDLLIRQQPDVQTMELFLPFHCFCTRREIRCEDIVLEGPDIAKALILYVSHYGVQTLLVGAASRNGFSRLFKIADVPSSVSKWAPDFCNVYVISKGKMTSIRTASRPVPIISAAETRNLIDDTESEMSAFSRGRALDNMSHDELLMPDTDISFGSSGRPSTDSTFLSFYENLGSALTQRPSSCLNFEYRNFEPSGLGSKSVDLNSLHESSISLDSGRTSWSSQNDKDAGDDKLRRLELEMKQTMDMYHAACKEALTAKQEARELHLWKTKEEQRLEGVQMAKEAALAIAENEKAKCKAANQAAKASQRIAELEVQKRVNAEMDALKEAEEKKKVLDVIGHSHTVLKYQSLFHISVTLFLVYFYFMGFK